MRISETGKITEDLHALGIPRVPVYLLDGPEPVLFDAGFTCLASLYEDEIRRVLGPRAPAYLFLTHAHFDHVGAASHLKTLWPEMKICCSDGTLDILARPRAIRLIEDLNRAAGRGLSPSEATRLHETPYRPFHIDKSLVHNQTIALASGLSIEVVHTPGHTWDFMSYRIPEKNILIASEAVGWQDASGFISAEFLVDYDAYRRSMEMLAQMPVEVLCPGHWLVLTGPDVGDHMERSLGYASEFVGMVEGFLREEEGDIEAAVTRVKAVEWDSKPWPKQTEPAYVLNTRARVTKVMARMRASKNS